MKLLNIDVTLEEFDFLMCEQAKGKVLKVVDGKIVAVDHEPTQEELLQKELIYLEKWFDEYDNQIKQYQRCQRVGIVFDKNIKELDAQATINQQRISDIRKELKSLNV